MWLPLLAYQLALVLLGQAQNEVCRSHSTFREPTNSDITVTCGTQSLQLHILLCPVYYGGYNESLMSLNGQHAKEECKGTPDWSVDPPVLKFNFSITEEAVSACSSSLKVTQEIGTGVFSDFSKVQFVNISGKIRSLDPEPGTITYRSDMVYKFSCRYPLQYLVNHTEISVTGVNLAVRDKNGSFISTLNMQLYSDKSYLSFLDVPTGGLELKTRIFVQVKATNLTERFNVLLDRCYASAEPYPQQRRDSVIYDLFVGCNRDGQTVMGTNGKEQRARFSFETFRWVQRQNRTLSVFFLHCVTRLCERSVCGGLRKDCRRRRREAESEGESASATVSSGPILMRTDEKDDLVESEAAEQTHADEAVVAVAIAAGVIGVSCLSLLAFVTFRIYTAKHSFMETRSFYPPE